MKKTFIILFVVGLLLFFFYRDNNNPKGIILDLVRSKKAGADRLRYTVNLLGIIPVGEAIFSDKGTIDYKGSKVRHLNAEAKNLDIYHFLRKASASIDSYLGLQDHNPVFFGQRLSLSGAKDNYKEVFYDQKSGIITVAGQQRQMPSGTKDPLSAIFALRRMDFTKNKDFEFNVNTNQKNYVLKGTSSIKSLNIKGREYEVTFLKARIYRRGKNPYHQSVITMALVKEGHENIPVLFKVFAGGILINARLEEAG